MSVPSLDLVYLTYRPTLLLHVARSFPRLCRGTVEDATEATFEALLTHPERFDRAWNEGGEARALGLMRQIAWRCARALVSRGAGRREVCVADWTEHLGVEPPSQDAAVDLGRVLERFLDEAVAVVSPVHASTVAAAFHDRIRSGDDDTTVARRHGIPREYISRVRKELRRLAHAPC